MEESAQVPMLSHAEAVELLASVKRGRTALRIVIPVCLLLVAWTVYAWFDHRASLELQHDAQAQNHARETSELLRMAAYPIGVVIRREMTQGSLAAIERYFRQLQTFPGIAQLTLVRNDGKILASTERGHEGMEFNHTFRDGFSKSREVSIDREKNGIMRVVIPIVDRDMTMGVVILVYQRVP